MTCICWIKLVFLKEVETAMSMIKALTAMLNKSVISAESQETPLEGGTVGNVRLISGEAVTNEGEKIPFKIVYKSHKKFERSMIRTHGEYA